jgi:hypothetical protein
MVSRSLIRRIERAGAIAAQNQPTPQPPVPDEEVRPLARESAEAFNGLVKIYREQYGMSHEDACRASESSEGQLARAMTCPPEQVQWRDLGEITRRDPEAALARWNEIRAAAREDLVSGHCAASAVEEWDGLQCWERARFLALRDELAASVGNPSPSERILIDQLAGMQLSLWQWQRIVTTYTFIVADSGLRSVRMRRPYEPTLLSEDEALKHAVAMTEKLQNLFLRTLKALHDQRRGPRVILGRAAQVNVGQQQANLKR